jgi:hypothetical protein
MSESEYPEKTCSADRLVRHPMMVKQVVGGTKRRQRRNGVYVYPGEIFTIGDKTVECTALFRQALGEIDDAAAILEGFPSLAAYKGFILKMHKGMEWDDSAKAWVHEFKLID